MTPKQLLILCTTTGYQTQAFVETARMMGLSVFLGTDRCHVLEDPWQDGALPLRFEDPERSAAQIVDLTRRNRIDGVVALGDRATATAARSCKALGLPYHAPAAVDACRDKYRSRERLRAAGLHVPVFARHSIAADPRQLVASGALTMGFPCVLKPLTLSGSRGVIRADNAEQFVAAFERIRDLLCCPEVRVLREDPAGFIQAEAYVDGAEVAVEAVVDRGQLRVLAIFDKPDLLEGPYFEETLYVTPSRLPKEVRGAVTDTLTRAVRALGLFHGPIHAEFRVRPDSGRGPEVWVLEIAARCIGGLCSRALRFCSPTLGEGISLEELLIHLALGKGIDDVSRETAASGVMMIPIPQGGVYQGVEGVEAALRTTGVEDIVITAKPSQRLVPLPEGGSYLGFIFARGTTPHLVEAALRRAHGKLRFSIAAALPVL